MRKIGYVTEGLRINRPSISYTTSSSRKISVAACQFNNHTPLLALNGKTMDMERNEHSIDKPIYVPQKQELKTPRMKVYAKDVNKSKLSRFLTSYELDKVNF